MDKRVVFAVAGSGKTTNIINRINKDSRCLIITYTDNNAKQLKFRIIAKFGEIPKGVRVYTYFTFLYSFCFRPICGYEANIKGINFTYPVPKYAERKPKDSLEHYIDKNNRVFSSRLAKLLIEFKIIPEVNKRIESFFDLLCIDEVQDFAGNDFNLLCNLTKANIEMQLVGDFYQHTFDTSRDGNTQANLHSCFDKYQEKFINAGFCIDSKTLSYSYRCSPSICNFVEEKLKINIQSHRTDLVEVRQIVNSKEISELFADDNVIKLFYKQNYLYRGKTDNWGNTKGLDHFNDVCVILNSTTYKAFESDNLKDLAPTTKNKLYVACTRAKGNLYFINEKLLKDYKK